MKMNNHNVRMVIPGKIHSHFEQKDEEAMPVLLIGFTDNVKNKPLVIALDPNAASDLINEMNESPMKMYIKVYKEKKDIMFQ